MCHLGGFYWACLDRDAGWWCWKLQTMARHSAHTIGYHTLLNPSSALSQTELWQSTALFACSNRCAASPSSSLFSLTEENNADSQVKQVRKRVRQKTGPDRCSAILSINHELKKHFKDVMTFFFTISILVTSLVKRRTPVAAVTTGP